MAVKDGNTTVEILMVEDNGAYVRLTQEALSDAAMPYRMSVVRNGVDALRFLRREGEYANSPRPQLILLDLNLPMMNGHEVLSDVKADIDLKKIPVIVLTNSMAEDDVRKAYELQANYYIVKPDDLEQFSHVVKLMRQALAETEASA